MMKYRDSHTNTVTAEYDKEMGNPFLEALPELMGKSEFMERMSSEIRFPYDLEKRSPQERRTYLTELSTWFQPMDYHKMIGFRFLYAIYIEKFTQSVKIQILPPVNLVLVQPSGLHCHCGRAGNFPVAHQLHHSQGKYHVLHEPVF